MDSYHSDLSPERLISRDEEEESATIHELDIEEEDSANFETTKHCGDRGISCHVREIHLSDSAAYESWAITYRRPSESLRNWSSFLGYKFRKTVEVDPGKIIAVVPKTRFAQSDLEDVVVRTKTLHRWNSRVGYEEDLERRLHKLDYRVQDELYAIMERQEADEEKNYKLEVLVEVPSDPTDSGLRMLCRRWWQRVLRKNGEKLTPHVEYRIVLRESKAEDRSSVRVKEGYQVLID